MPDQPLPFQGLCFVGEFISVDQVCYGKNHASKAGEPVPGMYELLLDVGTQWPKKLSFFEVDLETDGPTAMAIALEEVGFEKGDAVAVKVRGEVQKPKVDGEQAKYINFTALRIAKIDSAAPQRQGREPLRVARKAS